MVNDVEEGAVVVLETEVGEVREDVDCAKVSVVKLRTAAKDI